MMRVKLKKGSQVLIRKTNERGVIAEKISDHVFRVESYSEDSGPVLADVKDLIVLRSGTSRDDFDFNRLIVKLNRHLISQPLYEKDAVIARPEYGEEEEETASHRLDLFQYIAPVEDIDDDWDSGEDAGISHFSDAIRDDESKIPDFLIAPQEPSDSESEEADEPAASCRPEDSPEYDRVEHVSQSMPVGYSGLFSIADSYEDSDDDEDDEVLTEIKKAEDIDILSSRPDPELREMIEASRRKEDTAFEKTSAENAHISHFADSTRDDEDFKIPDFFRPTSKPSAPESEEADEPAASVRPEESRKHEMPKHISYSRPSGHYGGFGRYDAPALLDFYDEEEDEEYEKLDSLLRTRHETFHEMLFRLMDETGKSDPEIYKMAHMDRRYFSKIRSGEIPKRETVMALCLALRLDADTAKDLMNKAGYGFSNAGTTDRIVLYCIENGILSIQRVNEILVRYHLKILR